MSETTTVRNWIRATILATCLAAVGVPTVLADPPAEHGKPLRYLMVLKANAAGKNEPDVRVHGGRELSRLSPHKRVIEIPRPAIEALSRHAGVHYLALVNDGTETDAPKYVLGQQGTSALRMQTDDDPEYTWDSGDYEYDGAGNITAIGSNTFRYDKAQRLDEAVVGGETIDYTYDSFGNQIQRQVGSVVVGSATSTRSNQLNDALYDRVGNQLSGIGGVREYRYDAVNMMTERKALSPRRYIYTADDERIGTETGINSSNIEWTIRDFSGRVLSTFESYDLGQLDLWVWLESHHHRGGGVTSAIKLEERTLGAGNARYFHVDHLGTPRLITNQQRQKIALHDYHPFGKEQTRHNQEITDWQYAATETMQFTGHERDYTASIDSSIHDYLDYMHARFYNPSLGRFLSVDPARASAKPSIPQSWNRYSYAANNPLKFVDRNGQYYELASAADRQFFVDAIAGGTSNKAARELVQRQAGDPLHKIVLRTGSLPGAFVFGDSSRLHAPYRTISGNLFPSGITTTVDKGKLAMTNYPTPTISTFHELKHVDTILYQGMAANARQPDTTTLNTTTGQVTTNSIFEDFGRAAATTADDPMHALSPDAVSKLIADPGEGKAKTVTPCESIMCLQRNQ